MANLPSVRALKISITVMTTLLLLGLILLAYGLATGRADRSAGPADVKLAIPAGCQTTVILPMGSDLLVSFADCGLQAGLFNARTGALLRTYR